MSHLLLDTAADEHIDVTRATMAHARLDWPAAVRPFVMQPCACVEQIAAGSDLEAKMVAASDVLVRDQAAIGREHADLT